MKPRLTFWRIEAAIAAVVATVSLGTGHSVIAQLATLNIVIASLMFLDNALEDQLLPFARWWRFVEKMTPTRWRLFLSCTALYTPFWTALMLSTNDNQVGRTFGAAEQQPLSVVGCVGVGLFLGMLTSAPMSILLFRVRSRRAARK